MKYKLVCLGGTFDLLHKGHKALLDKAFLVGEKVVIGVVVDENFNFQFSNPKLIINNKKVRVAELKTYLRKKNYLSRAEIVEINDIYGPTITNPNFEAIIVSKETIKGAEKINQVRKKRGFKALKIIVVPMEKDKSGKIISSTRIRKGEINRQGFVYNNLFKKTIKVSEKARRELKKPQGEIISSRIKYKAFSIKHKKEKRQLIILVGDTTVKKFLAKGLDFDIGIIDLKVERKEKKLFSQDFLKKNVKKVVENKAGTISKEMVKIMAELLKMATNTEASLSQREKKIIRVIGEEDLAAVPAVLLSPLGSLVFYGQPKKGLVMIEVTEKIKEKIKNLLKT